MAIKDLHDIEERIADGLSRALAADDFHQFRGYVGAAYRHPSSQQAPALTRALELRSPDVNPEDVVEVLEVIRDPAAVPYLIDALNWRPERDEYHHLGKECILALAAIGTAEAIQALYDAAAVGPLEIREAAVRVLELLDRQQDI